MASKPQLKGQATVAIVSEAYQHRALQSAPGQAAAEKHSDLHAFLARGLLSFGQAGPFVASAEGRSAAAAYDGTWLRATLFAAYVLLVALRIPSVLSGRLWAEDGFFLLDALRLPWRTALLQPHTGYLDIVASATMVVATHMVALEDVPRVSVAVALAVQVLPGLLLVTGGISWLRSPLALGAALLILATTPLAEEVWLSPITSQYHLIVATGIILASEPARGWTRWLQRGVLLVAPFAGPGPSLIAPLFLWRALRNDSPERLGQCAIISAGTVVQVWTLLHNTMPERGIGLAPDLLLVVVAIKHILVPMLSRPETIALANPLMHAWLADRWSAWPVAAMAGVAVALAGLGAAARASRNEAARWLFLAAVITMLLSYAGALGSKQLLLGILYGQRYYVAPQMLFGLTLVAIAVNAPGIGRILATGLCVWLIAIGVYEFSTVDPMMASGPEWQTQIAAWRSDPSRPIALWPRNFAITLPAAPGR
jgi:hypothetical protein